MTWHGYNNDQVLSIFAACGWREAARDALISIGDDRRVLPEDRLRALQILNEATTAGLLPPDFTVPTRSCRVMVSRLSSPWSPAACGPPAMHSRRTGTS